MQMQALNFAAPATLQHSPNIKNIKCRTALASVNFLSSNQFRILNVSCSLRFSRIHLAGKTRASAVQNEAIKKARWLLEPIGDGSTAHLDGPVPLPGSFELASDTVTVGRVADKADLVIPVPTVSGLHARLENKDGALFVTDLDSTNGTYVDSAKLRPGAVTAVPSGSSIVFGDVHLAAFRLSKLEENQTSDQVQEVR